MDCEYDPVYTFWVLVPVPNPTANAREISGKQVPNTTKLNVPKYQLETNPHYAAGVILYHVFVTLREGF